MATLEFSTTKQQVIVKKVYQAFFSPSQYEVKPSDREVIDRGSNYRLPFKGGELAVTTWGSDGPGVLLMHGWGGARAQMTGFVEPLLSAGYRVVAYDQPAHGESDGKMTNVLEIAPTMHLLEKREGKFDSIIAHSFGTLITSYALVKRNFPPPSRLVYFGAFNRLLDSLPRFQVLAKLPDEIIDGLREMIHENFGRDVLDAIVNEELVKQIRIPALMFHDRSDNVTPVEDSRAIANAWSEAQYIETNGLGHRGALQSGEVHQQVVKFLKN
ncbi:MAG: alpha/beta hydrolase [Anaerolineales bacterium]|nr:alpha/beta hydrolase [Anaerolineales bacterium]